LILLRGVTAVARDEATTRIRDAFSDAGAWITDVHFFSGVCTVFSFDAPDLPRLAAALAQAGVALDDPSTRALATQGADSGSLNVTFTHGDPDLRIEVPSVPG